MYICCSNKCQSRQPKTHYRRFFLHVLQQINILPIIMSISAIFFFCFVASSLLLIVNFVSLFSSLLHPNCLFIVSLCVLFVWLSLSNNLIALLFLLRQLNDIMNKLSCCPTVKAEFYFLKKKVVIRHLNWLGFGFSLVIFRLFCLFVIVTTLFSFGK